MCLKLEIKDLKLENKIIGDIEFVGISETNILNYIKDKNFSIMESYLSDLGFVKILDDNNENFFVKQLLKGEVKIFKTTDSEFLKYNGQECTIIEPKKPNEYDMTCCGSMYDIEFKDGFKATAFEDELE